MAAEGPTAELGRLQVFAIGLREQRAPARGNSGSRERFIAIVVPLMPSG
jgi:hypothetical protein